MKSNKKMKISLSLSHNPIVHIQRKRIRRLLPNEAACWPWVAIHKASERDSAG